MSTPATTDLTQRPPRSPRVRLGGYVILPRMLDKGRASIAGKIGEYDYNCPLDQRFTGFTGIDAEALLEQLKLGKSDSEMLEWVTAHAIAKPNPVEIQQWSVLAENQTPGDVDSHEFFTGVLAKNSKTRSDIHSWFELLDLDDYVTYGGKA
jgi:Domain of unknown function (DUF5069)